MKRAILLLIVVFAALAQQDDPVPSYCSRCPCKGMKEGKCYNNCKPQYCCCKRRS